MDPFLFALILGGAGLLIMAVAGFGAHSGTHAAHHGGAGHHAGGHVAHAGDAHTIAHAGHAHAGHTDGAHAHAHGSHQREGESHGSAWSWLSPRTLFSVLVGFGAIGIAVRPVLGTVLAIVLALIGGFLFEAALVRPLWNQLFKFESAPAQTLESAIMSDGRAVTGFDASGHGLVAIELGGEVVQLLAALTPDERAAGVRVRAGDQVRIEDVDGQRNRCTVSRVGLT